MAAILWLGYNWLVEPSFNSFRILSKNDLTSLLSGRTRRNNSKIIILVGQLCKNITSLIKTGLVSLEFEQSVYSSDTFFQIISKTLFLVEFDPVHPNILA